MSTLLWVFEHWWVVAYVAAIVGAWWFLGWRGAVAVATLGAGYWAYRQGQLSEEREQARKRYEAQKVRKESDDEIDRLDPDDINNRLDRWMRDDKPR